MLETFIFMSLLVALAIWQDIHRERRRHP